MCKESGNSTGFSGMKQLPAYENAETEKAE